MGLQDRDYMRTPRRVMRASDQRAPGDPRRADEIFLPGTRHARPVGASRMVLIGVCAALVTAIAIMLLAGRA